MQLDPKKPSREALPPTTANRQLARLPRGTIPALFQVADALLHAGTTWAVARRQRSASGPLLPRSVSTGGTTRRSQPASAAAAPPGLPRLLSLSNNKKRKMPKKKPPVVRVKVARKGKKKAKVPRRKASPRANPSLGTVTTALAGLSMKGMPLGVTWGAMRRTPGGSQIQTISLGQILTGLSSGGTTVSYKAIITNALFTKFATLLNLWDQVRMKALRVTLYPMQGVTAKGQTIAYFDYRSADATAADLANASMMQDAVAGRCGEPLTICWKKQSNVDDEFITTVQTANFNSKTGAAFHVVTEGADVDTLLYQCYILGVFEYTGSKA